MRLSAGVCQAYQRDGFVLLEDVFSAEECAVLRAEAQVLVDEERDQRILEDDRDAVRSLYNLHKASSLFGRLVADRRVAAPATQLLGGDIYVHQTQLNPKAAFDGVEWEWHQDYMYWQRDDGMPTPRAVNVVVYLNEMTMFNGPLFVVPGSHRESFDACTTTVADGWRQTLGRKLRHEISRAALAESIERNGMAAPLGGTGCVLLFDPRILHGSPSNISPYERVALFVRYNSMENVLQDVTAPRPAWVAERDPQPIQIVDGRFTDEAVPSSRS